MSREHRVERGIAVLLLAIGTLSFGAFAILEGARGGALAIALVTFLLVFLPVLALGVTRWREAARRWVDGAPEVRTTALLALPLVLYAVHGAAHGAIAGELSFGFVWRYVLWVGVPAALLLSARRNVGDPLLAPGRMAFAGLWLWVGLDWGLLEAFRIPAGDEQGLNLVRLLVLVVALVLFVVCTPVRDLGYTFRIRAWELGVAVLGLAVLAAVLVPLGLAIGFLEYGVVPFDPLEWLVMAFALYFTTTLHEELLFRGIVQNAAEKWWPGARPELAGLLLASAIFGLAHINNAPAPNYRYVLMAAIAGLVYGTVWLRTRKVTVSALTHLGVNWTWMLMLRGG